MHFNPTLVLGFVSAVVAIPAAIGGSTALLARAVDYSQFTAEELANANPETCCCCIPIKQVTNVDHLQRILAASSKSKRSVDYSEFTAAELADTNVETCCCCVPPTKQKNVAHLQRLIAASQ